MDLHVLRAQLKVLDAEAANLEYLLSPKSAPAEGTIAGKPSDCTTLQGEESGYTQNHAGVDLFNRAA